MSEMVERVALALWRRKRGANDDPNWPVGIDRQGYHQEPYVGSMRAIEWYGFLDQARTAIEAMREPTEVMRKAACPALRNYIESVPPSEREKLWGKPRPHRGYNVPDKVKHEARYRAMVSAALSPEGAGAI